MGLYKVNVQTRIDGLENSGVSQKNAKLIKDFVHICYIDGLSDQRILKYITTLKSIALLMNTDFDRASKTDIERLLIVVNKKQKVKQLGMIIKLRSRNFINGCIKEISLSLPNGLLLMLKRKIKSCLKTC